MKTKNKKIKQKRILSVIGVLTVLLIIINQITVMPFIWTFRSLLGMIPEQGNIGPYANQITNIEESNKVKVAVDGYEDAEITFYSPQVEKDNLPVIMYIHGGGWTSGNAQAVSSFAKLIASNGYIVANVDYALAPENPYPASTIQLVEVLNYIYENANQYNIDKNNIFIGGNSAGAHLSSQLGVLVSNSKYAKTVGVDIKVPNSSIKGLLLFNGVYNFDTAGDCGFPFFNKFAWAYTREKDYKNYSKIDEISTLKHIEENYPSTFITSGDADPLEPQSLEFAKILKEKGVDNTVLFWIGENTKLNHDYIYELDTKEAQKSYEMVIDFLNKHIGK